MERAIEFILCLNHHKRGNLLQDSKHRKNLSKTINKRTSTGDNFLSTQELNEYSITKICEYLSLSDLKSCRLVSKRWCLAVNSVMHQSFPINIRFFHNKSFLLGNCQIWEKNSFLDPRKFKEVKITVDSYNVLGIFFMEGQKLKNGDQVDQLKFQALIDQRKEGLEPWYEEYFALYKLNKKQGVVFNTKSLHLSVCLTEDCEMKMLNKLVDCILQSGTVKELKLDLRYFRWEIFPGNWLNLGLDPCVDLLSVRKLTIDFDFYLTNEIFDMEDKTPHLRSREDVNQFLWKLIRQFTGLEELNLKRMSGFSRWNSDGMDGTSIFSDLQQLQSLSYKDPYRIPHDFLQALKGTRGLSVLDIGLVLCPTYDDDNTPRSWYLQLLEEALQRHSKTLKELSLTIRTLQADERNFLVLPAMPTLTHLLIRGKPDLRIWLNEELQRVCYAEHLPNLKKIQLVDEVPATGVEENLERFVEGWEKVLSSFVFERDEDVKLPEVIITRDAVVC